MPFVVGNLYYVWCSYLNKEKICLCACAETPLFFWVNTDAKAHGVGQVPLQAGITNGIVRACHADLSDVKTGSPADLARARDHGQITQALHDLVTGELGQPIRMLPDYYREMALQNLQAARCQ